MLADETMQSKGWDVGDTFYENVSSRGTPSRIEGNQITGIGETRVEKIKLGSLYDVHLGDANVQTVTLKNVETNEITTRSSESFPDKNSSNSTPPQPSRTTIEDRKLVTSFHPVTNVKVISNDKIYTEDTPKILNAVKGYYQQNKDLDNFIIDTFKNSVDKKAFLAYKFPFGLNKFSIVTALYNDDGSKKTILVGGGKRRRKTNRKRRKTNRKRRRTNRRR